MRPFLFHVNRRVHGNSNTQNYYTPSARPPASCEVNGLQIAWFLSQVSLFTQDSKDSAPPQEKENALDVFKPTFHLSVILILSNHRDIRESDFSK